MDTATAAASDPRIERTRQVVLDAALALVAESGYGAVTIEAVAARSGVAKSTIYRHWPGRGRARSTTPSTSCKPPVSECQGGDVREPRRAAARGPRRAHRRVDVVGVPAVAHRRRRARPRGARGAAQPVSPGRRTLVDLLAEGVGVGELPPTSTPS